MWDAAQRGNIKLRKCELKEYDRMKDFIRNNPGCTTPMIRSGVGLSWRATMFLAYGVQNGDIRGDMGHPEKWWVE